ncbi:MAG: GNAT family N-acetyltransferase, partial [Segetibacter sp.]
MENTHNKVTLIAASEHDREVIYKIRHSVYANELNQHSANGNNQLRDDLDENNHYVVAKIGNEIAGFISITPPNTKKFSIDKYFERSSVPFPFDDFLYEIRLLTVVKDNRNSCLALALMYAAFRWVQSHGGKHIVAICRTDLIDMYCKAGLTPLGIRATSGKITFELAVATIDSLQQMSQRKIKLFTSIKHKFNWQLP